MSDVANFISAQMIRVPAARHSISEKDDPDFLYDTLKQIANELYTLERDSTFSMSSNDREELNRLLCLSKAKPSLLLSEQGWRDYFTLALEGRMRNEDSEIAKLLKQLAWRIIYAEKEQYILSDNPVVLWGLSEIEGADDKDFECVLPISHNCALHIGRYGDGGKLNGAITDDKIVRMINSRVIVRSHRFIFSTREERWVSKNIRVRRPPKSHLRLRFNGQLILAKYGRPPCPDCGREFTQEEWDSSEINDVVEMKDGGYQLVKNRAVRHPCSRNG